MAGVEPANTHRWFNRSALFCSVLTVSRGQARPWSAWRCLSPFGVLHWHLHSELFSHSLRGLAAQPPEESEEVLSGLVHLLLESLVHLQVDLYLPLFLLWDDFAVGVGIGQSSFGVAGVVDSPVVARPGVARPGILQPPSAIAE